MAKPPKKPPPPTPKKRRKKRRKKSESSGGAALFAIALLGLAIYNTNAAILLSLGMLPTFILAFTTKGEFKTQRIICVSITNLSGVVFLMADVWIRSSAFEAIVSSMASWVIMWGAASIGYALIFVGPMIAATVLQGLAKDRIKTINQQRQELIDLWGHEVAASDTEKPMPRRL